ncbi:hypothetical protein OBBRIDRAFT_891814 [Obba rivulosa]|uniref:Uncharacterized protein n=1 Tax=Obba rivulosa TaxID=1052685 RepID=A0A8E2AH53_9APHY|nr:hypothetical protein OBBRIDRAFT_891814 [Obba rivulosa]
MSVDVDNADTDQITYDPTAQDPWFFTHSTGNGGVFDSTLSEIHGPGGIEFTFTGSQISVLGTILPPANNSAPPSSTYTIDGGTPFSFTADVVTGEEDGVTFFSSPILSFGTHKLVIEVTQASAASPYLFDYLSYDPNASSASSSASSSSSSSPSPSSSSSSSTPTPPPPPTPIPSPSSSSAPPTSSGPVQSSSSSSSFSSSSSSPPSSSSSSHGSVSGSSSQSSASGSSLTQSQSAASTSLSGFSAATQTGSIAAQGSGIVAVANKSSSTNVGAIAGGVVGGVAVLVLVALALFFWCRRRNSPVPHYHSAEQSDAPLPHTPRLPPLNRPEMVSVHSIHGGGSLAQLAEGAPLAPWQSAGQSSTSAPYSAQGLAPQLTGSSSHLYAASSALSQDPFITPPAHQEYFAPPAPFGGAGSSDGVRGASPSLGPASTVSNSRTGTASTYSVSPSESASQVGVRAAGSRPLLGPRPSTSKRGALMAPPPPPATQHFDSGIRFSSTATPSELVPIDVPPMYTPD